MAKVELSGDGNGVTVDFFTKSVETLQELHGKRTVDQKQFDEMVKKLEDVERLYIELPKEKD